MTVVVGISIGSAAQGNPKQFKPRASDADVAPKSMPAVKAPAASATSKELRAVERETPKGSAHTSQKAPKPVALKPQKDKNPPMNFGGKGGGSGSGVGMTKQNSAYKGRLKQKGAAGHN